MTAAPWLAIDTATDIASVAVGSAERILGARSIRGARQHAAQIVPLIDQVCSGSGVGVNTLAGIVVGDGPGSFTGLRIGWAAAKGIAQEGDLPLVAVPTLLAAAHAAAGGDPRPIAVCFDALRGQVFGAVYAFSAGRVETLVAPVVSTVAALIRVAPVRPRVAVGDGAQRYADECASWTGNTPVGHDALPFLAVSLLALSAIEGYPATEPVYGRPAEAQAKWEAHHGRPLPHSSR